MLHDCRTRGLAAEWWVSSFCLEAPALNIYMSKLGSAPEQRVCESLTLQDPSGHGGQSLAVFLHIPVTRNSTTLDLF